MKALPNAAVPVTSNKFAETGRKVKALKKIQVFVAKSYVKKN